MKAWRLHPDEAAFLRRWARGHLIGIFVLATIVVMLQMISPRRSRSLSLASRSPAVVSPDLPSGWRRTRQGWENSSQWFSSDRRLEDWITHGMRQEPDWMETVLRAIKETSPISITLFQIAAILCIVKVNRDAEVHDPGATRPQAEPPRRKVPSAKSP